MDFFVMITNRTAAIAARWMSLLIILMGSGLVIAGITSYTIVGNTLRAERIITSSDACMPDRLIADPLTAYCQAAAISEHESEATGGRTYSEFNNDGDPLKDIAQEASFLRASLFTSVVAFGVSALAAAIGLMFLVMGVIVLFLIGDLGRVKMIVEPKPETVTLAPKPESDTVSEVDAGAEER
jgi:hypothetical protein